MSLTLKLSSLVIRTLSKPIANQIKAQAREHPRFRGVCVSMAQIVHRFDVRLRLNLLRDTATSQRQTTAEAAARRYKSTVPTVKTEVETKAEEAAIAKAKAAAEEVNKPAPKPYIRPLSEAKAIEIGANFISETFLFLVAGGLIVFESFRSRRKETTRREDVDARLAELEQSVKAGRRSVVLLEKKYIEHLVKQGELPKSTQHFLPREVWEVEEQEEADDSKNEGWLTRLSSYIASFGGRETAPEPESSSHKSVPPVSSAGDVPPKPSNP